MSRYLGLGAALMLAACGGGGGGGGDDAPDHYPLNPGDVRVLAVDDGSVDRLVVGATTVQDGRPATPIDLRSYRFGASSTELVSRTEDAVWRLVGPSSGTIDVALGPYKRLNLPLRVGDRFVSVDREIDSGADVDGDGVTERAAVRITVEVVDLGSLPVAGRLRVGMAHVRTESSTRLSLSRTGVPYETSAVLDEWFAPGLGLVQDRLDRTEGGRRHVKVRRLLAWKLDGTLSEADPPTLVGAQPAAGSRVAPTTLLAVEFSEAIDPTQAAPAPRVLSPSGRALPILFSVQANQLRIAPLGRWPEGPLRLELGAGLRDLLGNPLQPVTITYEVVAAD